MNFREFIIPRLQTFFFLVTMILLAQVVLGNALEPDRVLHYKDFIDTFVMAGLCMLPTVVTYSKKELTLKQMIVRHIIQLVLIEGIMLFLTVSSIEPSQQKPLSVILIAGITAVIYALAIFIMWYRQHIESKNLNELLKKIQE
ncbi:MAG: hypothetical protein UHY68_03305 [Acutalibacteraceae bacterium]|nr:hypothetical protein [Acutalibacteraceae bacterium]